MDLFSVRRRMLTLAALGTTVAVIGCEDKRVSQLDTGITRDSAVTILNHDVKGGGRDSFPNVYKRDRYRINGKTYEVLFFTANNEKVGKDSVPLKKLTPLVFVENKMVAKGWDAWDSISTANKIPVQKR